MGRKEFFVAGFGKGMLLWQINSIIFYTTGNFNIDVYYSLILHCAVVYVFLNIVFRNITLATLNWL